MTTHVSQCIVCVHFRRNKDFEPVCDAFPSGIPIRVYHTFKDHRQPIDGDHGIRFWASPGLEHPFVEEESSVPGLEARGPEEG